MVERFALLFPGQGAQAVGMGKELAETFPQARACFEEADTVLGTSLSQLCWEGPAETLTRTEHCQPALYVTSMAALAALQSVIASQAERGEAISFAPAASAGLSLGEYTALAASGAVGFSEGLKLVQLRGQAMEEAAQAAPGTMASVMGLELEALQGICSETGAQVANLNSPGQIAISGTPEAVEAASVKAKSKGAKRVIPLQVGGAFHSRLMEPAAERLQAALEQTPIAPTRYPVLSNVTGDVHGKPEAIRALLVQQMTSAVQWEACVRQMLKQGIKTFLELGSGTVLKGLMRKIDPGAEVISVGSADQVRQLAAH